MKATKPSVKYYTFEELLEKEGYLVYTNVGVSMLPLLRQNRDVIEIRPLKERAKKYDAVLYKAGKKYILHRVMKVRPKDYIICGDHNIRREFGITDDMILGVMTRVIRDGKSITTDNWTYRMYVHMWVDFYHVRAAILFIKASLRAVISRITGMCQEKDNKNAE